MTDVDHRAFAVGYGTDLVALDVRVHRLSLSPRSPSLLTRTRSLSNCTRQVVSLSLPLYTAPSVVRTGDKFLGHTDSGAKEWRGRAGRPVAGLSVENPNTFLSETGEMFHCSSFYSVSAMVLHASFSFRPRQRIECARSCVTAVVLRASWISNLDVGLMWLSGVLGSKLDLEHLSFREASSRTARIVEYEGSPQFWQKTVRCHVWCRVQYTANWSECTEGQSVPRARECQRPESAEGQSVNIVQ